MFKLKSSNSIYEEALRAVSSAESDVRYWQREIGYNTSLLADLQGEKVTDLRQRAMMSDEVCDSYDEFGRPAYLTSSDLLREVKAEICRLEKMLASAKEVLAEKRAELEKVQSLLAAEEAWDARTSKETQDWFINNRY